MSEHFIGRGIIDILTTRVHFLYDCSLWETVHELSQKPVVRTCYHRNHAFDFTKKNDWAPVQAVRITTETLRLIDFSPIWTQI